jgi:hypothetical protein
MSEKLLAELGELYPGEKSPLPPNEGRMIDLHAESKGLIATPEEALLVRPDRQHSLITGGATADIGWTSLKRSRVSSGEKEFDD